MSGLDHEKEFEAYLAGRNGLRGRLAGAESLEPPSELDRIVLAQAREAIRMPEPPRHYPLRWAMSGALAATFMLTFALVVHFGLLPTSQSRKPETLEVDSREEAAQSAQAVSADVAGTASSATPAPVPMPESASAVQAESAHELAKSRSSVEPPQEWLRRIEALRAAGRSADAQREWRAFRKAWPDYPVTTPPQP